MHEIFTNRYCDLELHVKCDNPREFINIINAFKEQSNLDPSIVKSYSGDINDYCRAFTRGSGDIKYVSLAQVIGEYACDHNNNAFLDIINETGFNETIHYAVDNGAFEQVEYILDINSSYANAPGPRGKNPLYHAITNVNVPMVELLLDRGADPALLYGNNVLSNYLDHALWVYDHYYGNDEYNEDKITIIRRIMSYGTEPTQPLTEEQQAVLQKVSQEEYEKPIYNAIKNDNLEEFIALFDEYIQNPVIKDYFYDYGGRPASSCWEQTNYKYCVCDSEWEEVHRQLERRRCNCVNGKRWILYELANEHGAQEIGKYIAESEGPFEAVYEVWKRVDEEEQFYRETYDAHDAINELREKQEQDEWEEQKEWEALRLEHEEEERRLREEEEIQKDFEYWEAMEEANRPKTRGEQLVEEEEMRIRDRQERRWRLERRW